jgi:preprotein translocase subunit YajC
MSFLFSDAFAADETSTVKAGTAATSTATTSADAVPYDLSAGKMMQDNFIILGMLFFIFYFILIRPQQKRLKQHNEMIKSLQKGSKVITSGGIIGTIVKFEGDDVAVVEIAQGVRVRLAKSSISEVADDKIASGTGANDN